MMNGEIPIPSTTSDHKKDILRIEVLAEVWGRIEDQPRQLAIGLRWAIMGSSTVWAAAVFGHWPITYIKALMFVMLFSFLLKFSGQLCAFALREMIHSRKKLAGVYDFPCENDFEESILEQEGLGLTEEEKKCYHAMLNSGEKSINP